MMTSEIILLGFYHIACMEYKEGKNERFVKGSLMFLFLKKNKKHQTTFYKASMYSLIK